MDKNQIRNALFLAVAAVLLYSFKGNPSWIELCSGLAFFLFGMQCMTDGLQQLAGGKLEKLLAKSTAKPWKAFIFGGGAAVILQSTTIVSLLVIAFINASLITLAGGFSILLGAYIGSSSGIWLLALAGQSMSLSVITYPMLVLGVLLSFNGDKSKAFGRVILGIAFIFLAITHMKAGFSDFTTNFDFAQSNIDGWQRFAILITVGFLATMVLQSSHATIMLILTALDLSQITLHDSFILTVGALLGSTVSTSIIGFIGGTRDGKRLAVAHIIFHFAAALVILVLLSPITALSHFLGRYFELNDMMELAFFHTLFNGVGVLMFWWIQGWVIQLLKRIIPDEEKAPVIVETAETIYEPLEIEKSIQPKYLREQSLSVPPAAVGAIFKEVQHLGEVSSEVLCLSLNIPLEDVTQETFDEESFLESHTKASVDANILYQRYVKGLYGDILIYMSRIDFSDSEDADYYQDYLLNCQMVALSLVDAVKSGRHLQKNFNRYLTVHDSIMRDFYQDLKLFIYTNMRSLYSIYNTLDADLIDPVKREEILAKIDELLEKSKQFERVFRRELFVASSKDEVNAFSTSSVMNDLSYCRRLLKSLYGILRFTIESQAYPFVNSDEIIHEKDVEPILEEEVRIDVK